MSVTLKDHFAMIRDKEEVMSDLYRSPKLLKEFQSWSDEEQTALLNYCTGVKGVKILYDNVFKAIIDPENRPERLEDILSQILEQQVKILKVLPNESVRIATEKSLLVLDIVVEMEDGSIANVEVQRIGYKFPGQRSACYSADLLMRQYKRVKGEKKKAFRYSDIKKVYTIIFFEKSTREFHRFQDTYLHRAKQQTNTGLQMDLLQEYVFISLDIFKKAMHNKGVRTDNRLEAWLTFLCEDEPEWILRFLETHPEFTALYEEVFRLCRNTEYMMGIFSDELAILDENTVQYMIDEMQETIDQQSAQLDEKDIQLSEKDVQLSEKEAQLDEMERLLKEKDELIKKLLENK